MTSQERLIELVEKDEEFAAALESDPLSSLRERGFDDLVQLAEQERDRIGELVDRIYDDDEFRQAIEQDPIGELRAWGLPELAIEPVLVLAGAPDDVLGRATEDVEAHMSRKPATVAAMAAVLGTLAFAQQASAAAQPARMSSQVVQQAVEPLDVTQQGFRAASVERAQVSRQRAAAAQVRQQARPATARWQGVRAAQARGQGRFVSLLVHRARF